VQTHLQVRPVGRFSRFVAQKTRNRAMVCLLGVLLILYVSHLGGRIPPNSELLRWGVNGHFQVKYWNFHSTESQNYCIDRNQILHNDRSQCVLLESSWVVQINPKQIHDGGRGRHLEKPKNRDISTTDWTILIWHGDISWPCGPH